MAADKRSHIEIFDGKKFGIMEKWIPDSGTWIPAHRYRTSDLVMTGYYLLYRIHEVLCVTARNVPCSRTNFWHTDLRIYKL